MILLEELTDQGKIPDWLECRKGLPKMTLNVRNKQGFYAHRLRRRIRYILKKFYQQIYRSNRSEPVFVLGSGRSGTDIVAHCLSKSWDTELINEDNPKAFENWRLKSLNVVSQSLDATGASLVILKPIVETLRASEFLEHFSSSSVVFVIRNPFDAINSMARFFGQSHVKAVKSWVATDFSRQPNVPKEMKQFIADNCSDSLTIEDASGLYWLLYNSAFHYLNLYSCERVRLVRYEELIRRPEQTMKQVCEFLDLKWRRSMTDEVYSGSVGKNSRPELSASIENACLRQWERLTGESLSPNV